MNNRIILLVEDNPSDIGLTKRALGKNNIVNKLVVVEDGKEALGLFTGVRSISIRGGYMVDNIWSNLPMVVT